MATWYSPPPVITAETLAVLPRKLYGTGSTEWQPSGGTAPALFLEGIIPMGNGHLFFVDIPYGRILRYWRQENRFEEVVKYDGEPNGLARRGDGQILIADYKQGLLLLDPTDGVVSPFLTRRNLERFKGPNDLVVASNGDIYFTDQGQTGLTDPTGAVYRLRPSGELSALISNGPSPNGLVLDPQERFLYVAMTRDNSVWRCPLHANGTTTKVTRFVSTFGPAGPDGLTVDAEGNLFVCVPGLGSILVVSPRGIPIARIVAPSGEDGHITNCVFGSAPEDKQRLFFLVGDKGEICYIDWNVPGVQR